MPAMLTQAAPVALQRCHWYWNAVGLLSQVPFPAVRVCPTLGVPAIVGGEVFTGAVLPAARPTPASGVALASAEMRTSAASALQLCVFSVIMSESFSTRKSENGLPRKFTESEHWPRGRLSPLPI